MKKRIDPADLSGTFVQIRDGKIWRGPLDSHPGEIIARSTTHLVVKHVGHTETIGRGFNGFSRQYFPATIATYEIAYEGEPSSKIKKLIEYEARSKKLS